MTFSMMLKTRTRKAKEKKSIISNVALYAYFIRFRDERNNWTRSVRLRVAWIVSGLCTSEFINFRLIKCALLRYTLSREICTSERATVLDHRKGKNMETRTVYSNIIRIRTAKSDFSNVVKFFFNKNQTAFGGNSLIRIRARIPKLNSESDDRGWLRKWL